jgi:hypothetical protein
LIATQVLNVLVQPLAERSLFLAAGPPIFGHTGACRPACRRSARAAVQGVAVPTRQEPPTMADAPRHDGPRAEERASHVLSEGSPGYRRHPTAIEVER